MCVYLNLRKKKLQKRGINRMLNKKNGWEKKGSIYIWAKKIKSIKNRQSHEKSASTVFSLGFFGNWWWS